MPTSLLTFALIVLCVVSALGVGIVVGWILRGRQAVRDGRALHEQATGHVGVAFDERDAAHANLDEMTEDMRELATQYRELHHDYEALGETHNSTRLQLAGAEDELRVQQESARMAQREAGTARRRVGVLEGELRALKVTAARAVNDE